MIEEEAKTKWCPFVRLAAGEETPTGARLSTASPAGFNRISAADGSVLSTPRTARCIGSACMAWRWRHAEFEAARDAYEDSFSIAGIGSREEPKLRGHCGLAGSPE